MNIFTYLKKDHRKVSNLLEQITASPESTKNMSILEDIVKELTLHAETEQATFYKSLAKMAKAKKEITYAKEEHKAIKKSMRKVLDLEQNTPNWYIAFGELKAIVEHHVEEEETKIFKIAKKILSKGKAESLTEEMEDLKIKMEAKL